MVIRGSWRRRAGVGLLVAVLGGVGLVAADAPFGGETPPAEPIVAEAPDTGTALAVARRQGAPVRVADLTTETRLVHAKPDGKLAAELTTVPVRVRRGDAWVPVDTTLVRRPDGSVGPRAALTDVSFSGGGEAPLVRYGIGGSRMTLSWPGPLPAPVLGGDTATYPEVYPGVDVVLKADHSGYTQHVVVKTRPAAAAVRQIRLGMATERLAVSVARDGAIEGRDPKGQGVFRSPPSLMWDSAQAPRQAVARVATGRGALVITPDAALLRDPRTTYPVTIDPAPSQQHKNAWGGVYSGNANRSYFNATADPEGRAQVGRCNWSNCDSIVGKARTYFKFDTRWLAGKVFIKAVVNTVAVHRPDCTTHNHRLYWMRGEYGNPYRTWNETYPVFHDALDTQGVAGARGGCAQPGDHYVGFNTNGFINLGGFSSYLIAAVDENNSGAWRKYDQNRTMLYVEYNSKPNAPAEVGVVPWRASCKNCAGKVYLGDDIVTLRARLTDPDSDGVRPYWTVNGTGGFGGGVNSGDYATKQIDTSGAVDQSQYTWSVAAADWHDTSATVNGPTFVTDRKAPLKVPTVASELYPADNRWHGGVNVPGVFTFTPNFETNELKDIDHYEYGWDDAAAEKVDAPALNAPVSVSITPPGDGPRDLWVYSVDRAGRRGPHTVHHIYVRAGNGPLALWSFEGNARDTAFLGFRDGTLSGGTSYTPGAVGNAITLNATTKGHVRAVNTVNTKSSFSVSAWVRPAAGTTYAAVVSQDGPRFPGFVLWHWLDSTGTPRWVFGMGNNPDTYAGTDAAWSTEPAVSGDWTHLTGVYDATKKQLLLYVNGEGPVVANRAATPWNVTGDVQIGRTMWEGNYQHPFPGSIDEVAIYDRALSTTEVRNAVSRDNVQVGHWRLDEAAGTTTATNAVNGGASGVLTGGAAFTTPGIVDGSVKLDGTSVVTMPGPQLRTDRSFTVAGWVELDRQPTSGTATVVSQDGVHRSGFALQYRATAGSVDSGQWAILMPPADDATAPPQSTVIVGNKAAKVGTRAHVAALYDAATKAVRLYVNGELAGQGTRTGGFNATGSFVIGRGQWNDQPTDFLSGLVDEVRAYSRPLAEVEIKGMVRQNNVTEGLWKLDGGLADSSGKNRNGTQNETIAYGSGQTSSPDPADLALMLDNNGYVSAPNALDTSQSFSVSAWARLDRVGGHPVIVSQDGTFVSGFQLQATPAGNWGFVLFSHDRADGGDAHHRILGPTAQAGVWTHLVGVYDAASRQMHLYVNGALAVSGNGPVMWDAAGQLQIGAAKWNSQRSDRFVGGIDDVAVYNRVLFADEVRMQAGRDLSLVHNWTFDEPSGAYAADSVGSRTLALAGGYQRSVGASGNALRFDGSTAVATASTVDVRTDQSFTVSAWVHMDDVDCPDPYVGCRRDAVTVDGGQASKFRLGHVVDDGDNQLGSWIFEMPESDASPAAARAAVSVAPGEIEDWVHLVGVYDAPAKTIWLYVDAIRQKDGALDASWQASGGVAIGRGKAAGQPANHFPGMVDDVRLYTGVLDKNRVAALKASYPTEAATAPMPTDPVAHWKLDEGTGTTGVDAAGGDQPVTMTGGTSWIGGRKAAGMGLDGTSAWAQTAGKVVNTSGTFSVSAWTYLNATDKDRTLVAQDANRVSAFSLQYHKATGKWAVVVPTVDRDNVPAANTLVLTSPAAAGLSDWTHLAVTYSAGNRQLKLYVNGELAAMRADVPMLPSTGPLTLGRAKVNGANANLYRYGIDDVRAFERVLSAGEVRAVHDEAAPTRNGRYTFDADTPNDLSWRENHAVPHTSGVSYGPGLSGRAVVFDGVEGRLAAPKFGVSTRDSFTVSAWAKLSRKDQVATVVSQDGERVSSFFLQYRPAPDRWVFGQYAQDADGAQIVYAQSLQSPVVGKWTHLAGVYDYAGRQLRLYVNGELVGTKEHVSLWVGNGKFAIGRSKAAGLADGFFPGSVDEVTANQGIQSTAELGRMGWPAGPGGQLGRFRNTAGDRYSGSTGETPRPGYHFEATLGRLVTAEVPETAMLYACAGGADGFTSVDPACDGATVVGELGRVYTSQPTNVATMPIYGCAGGGDRFESRGSDCEGAGDGQLLGYTLAYAQVGRYSVAGDHWQGVDPASHGYLYEGPLGWLPLVPQPGTVPLTSCYDGVDQFLSTDGTCDGKTVAGVVAQIWPTPPSDMDSKALYACRVNGERMADFSPNCAGFTVEGVLGYVLPRPTDPSPVF